MMVADGGVVTTFLPYWLILLAFLGPWVWLLAWRVSRRDALAEIMAEG